MAGSRSSRAEAIHEVVSKGEGGGTVDAYLIVAADFVETGGMDRANLEVAQYAAARGHPVHLVTHRVSPRLGQIEGVRTHQVTRPLRMGSLGERALDFVGRRLAAELPVGTRIIVNGGNCAVSAVNWVHYVHKADVAASDSLRRRATRAIARWSERRAIEQARLFIANSERTRSELVESYGVAPQSIRTVYCGVDPTAFVPVDSEERATTAEALGFRSDILRIVFVGELGDNRKGFDLVFEAWRQISAEWRDVEVVVVGAGRMLSFWRQRCLAAGLAERMRFVGHRRDVAEILRSSDLLIAPSRYEPYGLSIAEAISVGLPVIATRTAGAAELLVGEMRELLLSDPPSGAELLSAIRRWRLRVDHYRGAALEASERVRGHSWSAMSASIYVLVEAAFRRAPS